MEPGTYIAKVLEHDVLINEKSGNWYIAFLLEVDGEKMHHSIYLTPKAAGMARGQLKAVGFDSDKRSTAELSENKFLLAGAKCEVVVEDQEYNGKVYTRIARIQTPKVKLGKKDASSLDKMLREAKKNRDEEALTTAQVEPPDQPDDDIPF